MIATAQAIADRLPIQWIKNLFLCERIIEYIFHVGIPGNGQGTGPDHRVGSTLEGFGLILPAIYIADQMRRGVSLPDEGRLVSLDDRVTAFQRAAYGYIGRCHLLNVPINSPCARMCPSISLRICSFVAPGSRLISVS